MPGAALAAIVDGAELGRPLDAAWPATAVLIAEPEPGELTAGDDDRLVIEAWRRLFRARVECAVAGPIASGAIDAAGLAARIAAIGRTEFDEARAVLIQDGLLWPPVSEAAAYAVFAAVFLELTYFEPSSRSALSSAAGPWQTAAMTLSSSSMIVSRRPSSRDSARSSIGPWPPGTNTPS